MPRFAEPLWLLALLVIPLYLWWHLRISGKRQPRLPFTRVSLLRKAGASNRFWRFFFPALRSLILLTLILAIAQPRWGKGRRDLSRKGVDIVMAVDISGSMLAMDFAPQNRLSAAVSVAKDFISKRPNDRFGLVAFSEYALTQSPLTFDHETVMRQLDDLEVNKQVAQTAIGVGLGKAVARLKDSTAKSKIVILITDGDSNTGEMTPEYAARIAREFGIRVYPIGVGSNGYVDYPIDDPLWGQRYEKVLMKLDMKTLDRIAEITGTGKAAQVRDSGQFQEIMDKIDSLERTTYKSQITYFWAERFMPFLWAAFLLLLLELVLRIWVMPVLPE